MKRTTLLTAALVIAAAVATATPAFAMRDPAPDPAQNGGMALYDYRSQAPGAAAPQPPRIGQAGLNNQYADGMNLYLYVGCNPVNWVDSTGNAKEKPDGGGAAPGLGQQPAGWTRALQLGPQWIGDGDPDYVIDIWHNLPQGKPAGAKQVWQVATCTKTYMYLDDKDASKCKLESTTSHRIDVVNIAGRNRIPDRLALQFRGYRMCFVIEACSHKTGFDDGKSNYAQQTNVKATQALANRISNAMRPPVGRFGTFYAYMKKENCRCCPGFQKVLNWLKVPDGEYLAVGGVGQWAK